MTVEKVVIIGSGPAGLAASIYAARAALAPLCFEGFNAGGLIPGGQLMFTTDVENYPGFAEGILGPALMKAMRDQALRCGARLVTQDVIEVDFRNRPFAVRTEEHNAHAHTVIIATGARANWLGLPNEKRLAESGGGVSACAVCDGALPLFRNQPLVVVGGGDSAVEEGSYLTKFASKVYLVHRRDSLRASKAMQERFFKLVALGKMEPVWNSQVVDVLGENAVAGVRLRNVQTGETRDLPCRGVFMAIGHTPNSGPFRDFIRTDAQGYILVGSAAGGDGGRAAQAESGSAGNYSTQTSAPGIFAAGDVADHVYRQAVTAAGTGCMAALDAERWLASQGIE